jgi:cytochrome c551/c552
VIYLKIIAALLIVAFIGIQFVPVERSNPRVAGEIDAPAQVKEILRRSCYDCHSNESVWPWYSYIAPASWLVSDDVTEGRAELNFSEWNSYDDKKKQKKIKEIWEEVEEGEMPQWYYILMHPEARLSDADKKTLRDWTAGWGK